jgi:hypothetical protein
MNTNALISVNPSAAIVDIACFIKFLPPCVLCYKLGLCFL